MNLLGGYDFVIEMAKSALQKNFQSSIQLPFEIEINLSIFNMESIIHIIVRDLDLQLIPNSDKIILKFNFDDTSIYINNSYVSYRISGQVFIHTSLLFIKEVIGTPEVIVSRLTIDTVSMTCEVHISELSKKSIMQDFEENLNVIVDDSKIDAAESQLANSILSKIKDKISSLSLSNFNTRPNKDGILGDVLLFEKAEKIYIKDDGRINIFATLLANKVINSNDILQKIPTKFIENSDTAILISSEAFISLLFCQEIATSVKLSKENTELKEYYDKQIKSSASLDNYILRDIFIKNLKMNLPSNCGTKSSVLHSTHDIIGDVYLTFINCKFENDKLVVSGGFSNAGTCYHASGSFNQDIGLEITENKDTKKKVMTKKYLSAVQLTSFIRVDWYCQVAAGLIGGFWNPIFNLVNINILSNIASNLSGVFVNPIIKKSISSKKNDETAIPDVIKNLDINKKVAIRKEGLILQFKTTLEPKFLLPSFITSSATETKRIVGLDNSIVEEFYFAGNSICEGKTFHYREYYNEVKCSFEFADPKLLGKPWKIIWYLQDRNGKRHTIKKESGNLSIPLDVFYPKPLPFGNHSIGQTVSINYKIEGKKLTISNDIESEIFENYEVVLGITIISPMGYKVEGYDTFYINGSKLEFLGSNGQPSTNVNDDFDLYRLHCEYMKSKTGPANLSIELDIITDPRNLLIDSLVNNILEQSIISGDLLGLGSMNSIPSIRSNINKKIYK